MASTSMQSTPTWKYDVFLSFRGKDTRQSFCGHLYAALDQKGIFTFKDNHRLGKGKVILSELFNAIEESMFSVVIISENYASSKWCLDELAKIVECMKVMGQTILPVFYNVSPFEVRVQTGSFEKVFDEHEKIFRDDMERVQKWRDAMTEIGNLSGWHLQDREESEVIREVVNEISSKVRGTYLNASGKLVGIDSRLPQILSMLGTGSKDVRVIGICGMGGIGKTTLARVVFDRITNHFDGGSFLANVREFSLTRGLVALQEQLISEIMIEKNIKVWDIDKGRHVIRNRLRNKRVLVILDDVDDLGQLQSLVGERNWFGLGSRIIITTRDRHLLVTHRVDDVYMVEKLNDGDALKLFCWNAFRNTHPTDDYFTMLPIYSMVKYADGLPLALEVLGSFLFGRSNVDWKHALDRLKEVPEKKIFEILKISYDGLQEMEKKIFLDIACFFKGKDKDGVREFLNSCNFYPDIAISVLIDKCIITLSNNRLYMHDLIQDMGKEIVRQEYPDQPGRRSRLWRFQDLYGVLTENEGTKAVEGIMSNSVTNKKGIDMVPLNAESFSMMKNLRLLIINGRCYHQIHYLSNELRLLKWFQYPLRSLPSNFPPENLYKLSMCHSYLRKLWQGPKNMRHLKIIKLCHSVCLTETPDFTGVPNLEKLVLDGCKNLSFLHPSIGLLKRLNLLNLKDCLQLKELPTEIEWESLEVLILSGCSQLRNVKDIVGKAKDMSQLHLDGTSIKEVPPSIQYLTRLAMLNLQDCKNLVTIPSGICELRSLKVFNLNGCSRLEVVPENLGHISSLEKLDLGGTAIHRPPSSVLLLKNLEELSFHVYKRKLVNSLFPFFAVSFPPRANSYPRDFCIPSLSGLCSLRRLDLGDCNLMDKAMPSDIGCILSLKNLNLSGNDFVSLPATISQLSKLETLNVDYCTKLQALPELPSSLNGLFAHNCTSLVTLSGPSHITKSTSRLFHLSNCFNLGRNCLRNTFFINLLQSLLKSQLQGLESTVISSEFDIAIPGSQIPEWFTYLSTEPSITTFLPRLDTNNLCRGLALCAVFSIRGRKTITDCFRYNKCATLDLHCLFNHEARPVSISLRYIESMRKFDHIWLCYISRNYFSHNFLLDNSRPITATFTPNGDTHFEVEVKACGLRPVYSHDVEEFIQASNKVSSDDLPFDTTNLKRNPDDFLPREQPQQKRVNASRN